MRRVLDVARILTVNWQLVLGLPVLILAVTLALNLAIFGTIGDGAPVEGRMTGAMVSVYFVMAISHLQTITQIFPFAIGLSVTRRAFYAGLGLVVVAQAVGYGLLLTVGAWVEAATDGWGLSVRFFGLDFLPQGNFLVQWLAYTVLFLAITAIGVFVGVVFKRWGQLGVWVTIVGTAVLFTGLTLLVTWQRWWPAVLAFFAQQPPLALVAGYPLVIALVVGTAGWFTLRRATP
jgi:hypothetical protein